mmetsp:Transcript_8680/g.20500  ORF Transcript_8680/g.20500 Transcript_8680/m.20500 type:complete len:288 (+) Transcript_8680:319-1182(+)
MCVGSLALLLLLTASWPVSVLLRLPILTSSTLPSPKRPPLSDVFTLFGGMAVARICPRAAFALFAVAAPAAFSAFSPPFKLDFLLNLPDPLALGSATVGSSGVPSMCTSTTSGARSPVLRVIGGSPVIDSFILGSCSLRNPSCSASIATAAPGLWSDTYTVMGRSKLRCLRVSSPGSASCTSGLSWGASSCFLCLTILRTKLGLLRSTSCARSLMLTTWKSLMRWKMITFRSLPKSLKTSVKYSGGHSSSMIVFRGAPPRTGSCTSESGFFILSVPLTSRRQFLDLK